ncbi:MAG: ImmA/IrrE family metallo-endopeptidase [Ignavibacteria bacterium]|nr:ImmA/IrrE family metallo-endopeptidase [Ignavibacteria bacterium]
MTSENLGKCLQEARKHLRLSQTAVAKLLNVTRQVISAYESGKRDISAKELQILCNLFRIYPNDLLGFKPYEHTNIAQGMDFRMNDDPDLTDHDKREIEEFYLRAIPQNDDHLLRWKKSFQKYSAILTDPFNIVKRLATAIRNDLGQDQPPINVYLLVEKLGVIITPTYFEKVAAVVYHADEKQNKPPRILVNSNQPLDRQRFSISHEVAHLFLHNKDKEVHPHFFKRQSEQKEIDADAFAAELLMPGELVKQSINNLKEKQSVEDAVFLLSYLYQVSFLAMTMRLYNLGSITRTVRDQLAEVKPSKLEGAVNKMTGKCPFEAQKHLKSLEVELGLSQKNKALNQAAVRKIQEIAYTRYLGEETNGGAIPTVLYDLEPAGTVYEKVAFWIAEKYPLFK